jgi:hypothetical protein
MGRHQAPSLSERIGVLGDGSPATSSVAMPARSARCVLFAFDGDGNYRFGDRGVSRKKHNMLCLARRSYQHIDGQGLTRLSRTGRFALYDLNGRFDLTYHKGHRRTLILCS